MAEFVWKRKFQKLKSLLDDFEMEAKEAGLDKVESDEFLTESDVIYVSFDLDVVDSEEVARREFGSKYKVFREAKQ